MPPKPPEIPEGCNDIARVSDMKEYTAAITQQKPGNLSDSLALFVYGEGHPFTPSTRWKKNTSSLNDAKMSAARGL